jgi:tetratricopeptide (TPR) repeat protein
VEQLRDDFKFAEAINLLEKIEGRNSLTAENRLSCLIIKAYILGGENKRAEAIELGKKAYELSQKLGNDEGIIDSLFIMSYIIFQGQVEEGFKILSQNENLIKNIKNVSSETIKTWYWELNLSKSWGFLFQGDFDKALEYGQENMKISEKLGKNLQFGASFGLMGFIYFGKNDIDKGMRYLNKSLGIYEKAKNLNLISSSCSMIGQFLYFRGQFNQSLKYLERSSAIKETSDMMKISNYTTMGTIFTDKGELKLGLDYLMKALVLAEKSSFNLQYSLNLLGIGKNLKSQGDFDGAIKYLERCLEVAGHVGGTMFINPALFQLLTIYLENGNNAKAQTYLNRLKQSVGSKEDMHTDPYFTLGKALMLKTSKRISDIGEAERILKEYIQAVPGINKDDKFALILLSEILLEELQMTNNLEVLNEINPLLDKLQFTAEKQHSYRYLAETNLLRAKLALIQNKTDEAQRLLSEAQRTADWHGLNYLAHKISSEHDKLLEQLELWEKLDKSNAPMSERIKLASMDGVMDRLQEKRAVEPPKMETEQSILLTIISRTGYIAFSNPFSAEMTIDEARMGDIISSFSKNVDQVFSETLDRIKIGEYMVMINPIESFSICYVFRGQSYSAGQKLTNFSEALKENKGLMELLNISVRTGQQLKIIENPDLEELITNSFMADPKKFKLPFQAYKGDDPFIFVSYAHSDKLQTYPIMDYLNKSGFNVWYDEGISASENWKKSIVTNIENCTAFLVFITPHILDSEYVRKEIDFALSRKKKFFSVYLKDTDLPSEMEFDLSRIQAMKKYTMEDNEFYSKIKEILSPVLLKKI